MHDKGMEINFKIGLRKVFSKMIVIIKIKNGFNESIDVNDKIKITFKFRKNL
jgi:hypothetical protein